MNIIAIIAWLKSHYKIVSKAIYVASVGLLIFLCVTLSHKNKKLSQSLEIANNNVEAYQGVISGSQQANRVLQLDMTKLQDQNDSIVKKMGENIKNNNIKPKTITTAATKTQSLDVTKSRGVGGYAVSVKDSITNKETTYKDSIQYNDLTKVYYNINKDSVKIRIKLNNDTYLYIQNNREYVNKKNFFKRLFTLDFKRHTVTKYNIYNTNDLIKDSNVRVIESTKK